MVSVFDWSLAFAFPTQSKYTPSERSSIFLRFDVDERFKNERGEGLPPSTIGASDIRACDGDSVLRAKGITASLSLVSSLSSSSSSGSS